jgi:outer membrane protein TolC
MRGWRHFFCAIAIGGTGFAARAQEPPINAPAVFPIDLPAAMRLAKGQSLDIRIARQKLAEARAIRETALFQFLPTLAPGITYRRHDNLIQDVAGNVVSVHKDSYAPGFTFTAQVEIGDAIYRELAARQNLEASARGLEVQQQDSVLEAITGFFDLAKAEAAIASAEAAQKISRNYSEQIGQAVSAGVVFKGEELRVRVQTDRAELAVRQAVEQRATASARLVQILHLTQPIQLVAAGELAPLNLVGAPPALDALVQEALSARPEIRQSKALVAAAEAAKKGATIGPLVPTVGAQAYLGGLGGGRSGGPDTFGESEDVSFFLSWRIGPGGLFDKGRIHSSTARWEIEKLSATKLRDRITREVVEALARFQSLTDQIRLLEQTVGVAVRAQQLAAQRKDFAVGTVLEDIQTQQELARARTDYFATVAEFNKAQYTLLKVVGRLGQSN